MRENTEYFGRLKIDFDRKREGFEVYRKESYANSGEFGCVACTELALGQHFLDFLENNKHSLRSVVRRYKDIYRYVERDFTDLKMVEQTIDYLQTIYRELSDIHVFWKVSLYENEILHSYQWFCHYLRRAYLFYDGGDITEEFRCSRMAYYWEMIRKGIQQELIMLEEFVDFVSSMLNAVSFCLDDTKFLEFKDLHIKERAYIYQKLFDKTFMGGLPIQTVCKIQPRRKVFTNYTGRPNSKTEDNETLLGSIISNVNYYDLLNSDNAKIDWKSLVEMAKESCVELTMNLDLVKMEDIFTVCIYSFSNLISQNIHVRPCRNCGKFFSPYNRSDEIYCARIQENNKSCRDNYYEKQLQQDEFTQYYRAVYKRRNVYKQRNLANKPSVEKEFKEWTKRAKKALEKAKKGRLTMEEFKDILDM